MESEKAKKEEKEKMSVHVYEAIKLRKAEQNKLARRFFKSHGGLGLFKQYKCRLCEEALTAPSPRLAALQHRHKHLEISHTFKKAGLYDLWTQRKTRKKKVGLKPKTNTISFPDSIWKVRKP